MKLKIVILITALILCATCITVGLVIGTTTPVEPTPSTPTEPVVTLPEELPDLNVEHGTYYFIGSTHTTWGLETSLLPTIEKYAITLIIGESREAIGAGVDLNHAYSFRALTPATGIAYSDGNAIIFDDNGTGIRKYFDINIEHDEAWYESYGKKEAPWTCTYDAETKTITFSHNSDFAVFRLFESDAEYAEYLKNNFMQNDEILVILYPEPITESTQQKGQ